MVVVGAGAGERDGPRETDGMVEDGALEMDGAGDTDGLPIDGVGFKVG